MNERNKFRPEPIPFWDEHGTKCLRVPLDRTGSKYAITTEQAYRDVINAGADGTWLLNASGTGQEYVRTNIETREGGTLAMVPRLIMDAEPRTVIRYINGDRLDLRPVNLMAHKGKSKRADMRMIRADDMAEMEDV